MASTSEKGRERLATRLGFILLAAGCAIGLGNVWRFPYIAGQNGGGGFVVAYLFFLVTLGLPLLVMEFATGRAAQRSIVKLHDVLTPTRPLWRVHGIAGLIGVAFLMMFYTTVTGWMLLYFWKTLTGVFVGAETATIEAAFSGMLANAFEQIVAMLIVTVLCAFICATGLQKGLERISKVLMLCLLILIVALAVNSITLEGAEAGLKFYLVPDFGRMQDVGFVKVIVEAMNHAFFTLSLGIGAMSIFGSYIGRDHALTKEAVNVASIDTFVAITAGLVILPACFAFGLAPAQGPGLVFVTLPNVFNQMVGGRFWGTVFFLFMSIAALTTVFAIFECLLAGLRDLTNWGRPRASAVVCVVMSVLSLPCIFGFGIWRNFMPFGPGTNVLDLEDFIVSTLLLPLGAFFFAVYCTARWGWGWDKFRAEANAGAGFKFGSGALRVYCAWVLPIVILVVFTVGLLSRFGVINL